MNKAALTKHEIYNKLSGFSEEDLASIASFVDFLRYQKHMKSNKLVKLQGILKNYEIDLNDLKQFKDQSWKHVDKEFANE
jgi:sensor histidine kinase regulating citrate/malate metabolism